MAEKVTMQWEDIKDSADELFNIWVGQPELKWAKKSWSGLVKQGLADYTNDIERHIVLIRLLTLANMYGKFCEKAFGESFYPCYSDWADTLDINYIRLGQLVGKDFDSEYFLDTDELFESAIEALIGDSKYKVFNALCKEFGNESMLFVGLWVTVQDDIQDYEDDEYEEQEEDGEIFSNNNREENKEIEYDELIERLAEYVLEDDSYDKLEAYAWVSDGMW